MQRALSRLLLAAAGLAGSGVSLAAACMASAGSLSFGVYDTVATSANDSSANLQVVCTPGASDPLTTPYTITVAGTGTGNDSVRAVAAGAYRLYYQVYQDAGRSQVWGNGSAGPGLASSVTATAVMVPAARNHTVYVRMPAQQAVPPGAYLGSLLVTVEY